MRERCIEYPMHKGYSCELRYRPEDRSSSFLRNVATCLLYYTSSHPKHIISFLDCRSSRMFGREGGQREQRSNIFLPTPKAWRRVQVELHLFKTSALDGGEQSTSRCCYFSPQKEPQCPSNRMLGGPQLGPVTFRGKKSLCPGGTRTRDHPARSLLAVSATLSRLMNCLGLVRSFVICTSRQIFCGNKIQDNEMCVAYHTLVRDMQNYIRKAGHFQTFA